MKNILLKKITSKRVIKAVLIVVGMGIGFAVFGGVLLLSLYLGDKYIYDVFYKEIFQKPIWYLFLCLVFVITSLLGIWLVFKVKKLKTNHKSFTLIELLVVIAIIGVLAAIVITSMSGAITKSKIVRLQAFSDSIRAQLSDSLVSYWSFNEGTGTDAKDMWEGNNGTLGGGTPDYYPTWKSGGECISGKCLEFDGVNDYVDCGSDPSVLPDAWTVEAWIKPGDKLYQNLVSFKTNYQSSILFGWNDAPIIHMSESNYRYFSSVAWTTLKNGQWHHVVFTMPGSGQDDILNAKMYLDSVSVAPGNTPHSSPQYAKTQLYIGSDSVRFFSGLIDEVHIYNSVVTIAQIQSQYLAGLDKLLSNGATSKSEYNQRIKELSKEIVIE